MMNTLAFIFGGAPGSGEIILVLAVLLMLFGAKRVPGIARNLGRMLEEFKRAARDVSDEIMHGDIETPKTATKQLPDGESTQKETDDGPAG